MDATHYQALGVEAGADAEEIKDAYWRLARRHHVTLAAVGSSSKRRASDAARVTEAEQALAKLDEAYAALLNPETPHRSVGVGLSHLPVMVEEAADGLGLEAEIEAATAAVPSTLPACLVCGGVPAAPAVLQEVTGVLVRYRVDEVREAFCGRCGTAAYRTAQARTLLRGWWGLFALIHNVGAVAANWAMAKRFDSLPETERPGQWPDGRPRPPLDPGAPLWRRPKLLVGGAILGVLMVAAVTDTFFL